MRRARTVGLLAFVLAVLAPSGSATVYVPGEHRSDGYYIRPHFLPSPDPHEPRARAPARLAPEPRRKDEHDPALPAQEGPTSETPPSAAR